MKWTVIVALASTLALGACASERDPINRTQPNAIKKTTLEGEWYFQQTVVDIPGTYSATFVGESNFQGMERVRFDVQEQWLYVRRSYERIKDAEGGVAADGTSIDGRPYMGAVLAAYPITSHFDVRRAYNPTTGEEYNVVEENTTDRPWYQREFVRVDWSQNYATNFQFMVDDMKVDPVAYYVQDTDLDHDGKPDDPDYPVIDAGDFDKAGKMVRQPYIDVTNLVMTRPGTIYLDEIGESIPICYLFSRATADCTTEPIKIRNSFLRLDPAREYVPEEFKGDVTDYFGLFTTDRLVFDPNGEVTEKQRLRYRQIHNLWKRWKDDAGNVIPMAQREVRPMVYYVTNWDLLPDALEGTLADVEKQWGAIFSEAIAATGNPYTGPVLKFCHSPVRADEAGDLCGAEGFTARLGDIRYNWIAYLPKFYDGFALLGLGPSNSDPLTGEVISAGAYLYVYNDIVAQTTAQQVQLLNGDLDADSYIDGVDLKSWQAKQGRAAGMAGANVPRVFTQSEVNAMAARTRTSPSASLALHPTADQLASLNGMSIQEFARTMGPTLYDRGLFSPTGNDGEGRLHSIADTYIEDDLLNPEIQMAAGIMPGAQDHFTEEMLSSASVARVGPIAMMDAIEKKRKYFANVRNVDLFETADDGYFGLAEEWKGKSMEEVREGVKDQIYHAVLTHELGHSFNLHHNFGGTEDAVNYGDDYWKLRAADGSVKPRWLDPPTDAELAGNLYRYAYSSIMDYSRLTLDYGPGKYDRAAILLGYVDKVEAFKNTHGMDLGQMQDWSAQDGQVLTLYTTGPTALHYTTWYNTMGDDLWKKDNRVLVDASDIDWDSGLALSAGLPRVPYIFCSPYQSEIGNNCYTRDYGADEYERIQNHIQGANTWYITRAFPRYQVGATVESYIGRSYDRIYHRLKSYNDLYALYLGLLAQIYTPAQIQAFLTDPTEGWGSYTIAEHDSLNFLLTTIATPDVTGFTPTTDAAGKPVLAKSLFNGAPVNTDPSNARFFTTAWNDTHGGDDCGMYFNECLNHFGFYVDKIMAMAALTDAQTNFVARDTAEDIREFRISWYDTYPGVIDDFFAGLMSQDWEKFAPRWTGTDVVHPDYLLGTMPAGQTLDPSTGFTVQLYAAVLGMARFQNNFDKGYLLSNRMWVEGSAFGVNGRYGVISFRDPGTGTVYQAINFPDDVRGGGVARRMLERANAVLARSSSCTAACATGVSPDDKAKADVELTQYGQLLDVMVDLTGYYETYTQKFGSAYDPGALP
jgi:hypothetical protein